MWSAPCESNCPLGVNIPNFLELVTFGLNKEAARIIKEATFPLSRTLAYICAHPCEDNCRYNTSGINSGILIHKLKRFLMDNYANSWIPKSKENLGKGAEVCIVGCGPAGLYAAYLLSSYNFKVKIYEMESDIGGMLTFLIPLYRLPAAVLKADIDELRNFFPSIQIILNSTIKDIKMLTKEYVGVILACGLIKSKDLAELEGRDLEGIELALPFLREAKKNPTKYKEPTDLIVIGGGNVAIDVARTGIRLGANKVKVVALEKYEELPAFPWEIEAAREEGIEFFCGVGPKRFLGKKNIEGLEVMEVKSLFDDKGRFSPTFYPERVDVISANRAVIAIGQTYPQHLLESLKITFPGPTVGEEGVFLAGDIKEGPTNVAKAMKSAKDAIYKLLDYMGIKLETKSLVSVAQFDEETSKKLATSLAPIPTLHIPHLPLKERISNFSFTEKEMDSGDINKEAKRCLACAQIQLKENYAQNCAYCSICVYLCPQEALYWDDNNRVAQDFKRCLSCGLCSSICPQKNFYSPSLLYSSFIYQIISKVKGESLFFKCSKGDSKNSQVAKLANVAKTKEVNINCFAKIPLTLLLFPYSVGKKEVIILHNCREECYLFHPNIEQYIKAKIKEVEEIISSLLLKNLKIIYRKV